MAYEQSVSWWSFAAQADPVELLRTCKDIGYTAMEMTPPEMMQLTRDQGLKIATTMLHGPIPVGINDPKNWDDIKQQSEANLKLAQEWDIPYLICFSGNRAPGIDDEQGAENSIKQLEVLARDAESAGKVLILELLNSKVNHPDYMCDRTAWGVQVVSAVDSPSARLLYDIYHMQVMEGDVIQTIRDNHQWFAHYHTAGVPGRNEIGQTQELYYPAICRAIDETGFSGYVGQEFVPVGDWKAALRQAYDACNVT
ncbi:MAG: TIM barrel protein [Chloroflexota bacterium]|nr:TIM barrel protein [Chloroflexota bacterium]